MKGKLRWPDIAGIVGVVGFAAVCLRGWPSWTLGGAASQTVAAWIQGVGSIAAIYFSYMAGLRQGAAAFRQALRLERRAERRRKQTCHAVIAFADRVATHITEAHDDRKSLAYVRGLWDLVTREQCKAAITAIDAIPLYEFGTPQRIAQVAGIRGFLTDLITEMGEVVQSKDENDERFARAWRAANASAGLIKGLAVSYRRSGGQLSAHSFRE